MEAAKQSPFNHYIIASFLLRTGMRKGEMLALHWSDIDFENKTASITKARNNRGVTKPKTKSSIRTIGIDDTMIAELKQYQLWQKKNKVKYGPDYHSSEFLITRANGGQVEA